MATVDRQTRAGIRHMGLRAALARTALRASVLATVAVFLANLHLPWRPRTLDLLRGLTGIPCPFCGTTTAFVHAGELDIVGAFAANPFVILGAVAVVTAPLTGIVRAIDTMSNRSRVLLAAGLLCAAEVWQLARFGLLG